MRQIGTLADEASAERFAAYLVTGGTAAHAEQENEGWAIWVRDENQVDAAKQELQQFRFDPTNARYKNAQREADSIRRAEAKRREQSRKNIIEMRGRWSSAAGMGRRTPLVTVLIVLSVAVFLLTNFGNMPPNSILQQLLFVAPTASLDEGGNIVTAAADPLKNIARGELWRLVTPIFVHFGILHIVFNMYVLHYFGSQIEDRRGTWRLALLVLTLAVLSNVAQAYFGGPVFGGMSGVDYGLFGYVWMKAMYQPQSGMYVSQSTILMLIIWFLLGFGIIPGIANVAHGAGLLTGVIIGYVPIVFRRS